ncbi:MAG: hypothetical protein AAFY60_11515, partial [Myxococcota bacterium]
MAHLAISQRTQRPDAVLTTALGPALEQEVRAPKAPETSPQRKPRAPRTPLGERIKRGALWLAYKAFVHTVFKIEVRGTLPKGGAVLASNHPSLADGPAAVSLSHRVRAVARPQENKFRMRMIELGGSIITNMPPGSVDEDGDPYPQRNYRPAIRQAAQGDLIWFSIEGQMHSHLVADSKS